MRFPRTQAKERTASSKEAKLPYAKISAREISENVLLRVNKLNPVMEAIEPSILTMSFQFVAIG
jgi:hypothetical protein